ncbi:MAG: sensor histidine kinase [Candidatus Reconcilbacillus cellulovorans]|uniref:Sensor histidine kinase n=1 Tax=Candidatus Reconcilbacillus cellulovorans TaxID=1906605 RepID=A0A2A6E0Q2_9BACL|nr:MAG: sensor histidine kinase [Candidatus Reconcilbacillus cellulovorans]
MRFTWRLSNVRLRNKMLLMYFFSVFLPIVLTNVAFYRITVENVRNQRIQDIGRAIEQVRNDFRAEIEKAVEISTIFYTDFRVYEILEQNYAGSIDYILAYDNYLRHILSNYGPVYYGVQSITLYVDNPTVLPSSGVARLTDAVRSTEWYKLLAKRRTSQPLFLRFDTADSLGGREPGFSVVRRLDGNTALNEKEKIIKIDLRMSNIDQIFSNLNLRGQLYLLNERDEVVYASNAPVVWENGPVPFAAVLVPKDAYRFEVDYRNIRYLDGWRIVSFVPSDEVFSEVRKSRDFVFWMASLNMLIPTAIIVLFMRSLNARLGRILKHMKKVRNQNFETIAGGESADEIGQLTAEFNRMTLQIKHLIDEVYLADIRNKELEIQRRNAQLHALQSQINPHFLFNALETIRMRSLMKQEMETARIIHNMAKLLRRSLSWKSDWVSLKEEIDLVVSFLEIQKYRFGDKLSYRIDVSDEALKCRVPKMMLQPLVENASIHGIEPLNGPGLIEVCARLEGDRLACAVRDNGVGFDPKVLEALLADLEKEYAVEERVGIRNVVYRLKMYYGEAAEFRIDSRPGEGTEVSVRIPVDFGEDNGR